MTSRDSYPSPPPSPVKVDPILRNALRYTISAKEYESLHQYLISRSPPVIRKHAPPPRRFRSIVRDGDDSRVSAVRASLRVFVATQAGLQIWDQLSTHLFGRAKPRHADIDHWSKPKTFLIPSPNLRRSISLSLILLLYRLLFRFFFRLRANLLTQEAAPFRQRNPRIAKSLTSRLAPAIGASLAGFALGAYPGDQLRITIAIYVATRAAEFAYNKFDNDGWFRNKPWWWGSWMLMPLATGQLLHAFVFDRDCFPKAYGDFIVGSSPNYIQRRPSSYPPGLPWPSTDMIVDSLAEISRLNWPPFISPILFPSNPSPFPPSLKTISPIISPAHPSISSLSCALLHPSSPSCLHVAITHLLTSFPPILKFFTLLLTLLSLPRYKSILAHPTTSLLHLLLLSLRTATFLTTAIGTGWSTVCLSQHLLKPTHLPRARFFLIGALGGCWAFLIRSEGRAQIMYSVRLSLDSAWKVGVKRGLWRGWRGGEVGVFVLGLAALGAVYEVDPEAVRGGLVRRGVGWLRGEVEKEDRGGEEDGAGDGDTDGKQK